MAAPLTAVALLTATIAALTALGAAFSRGSPALQENDGDFLSSPSFALAAQRSPPSVVSSAVSLRGDGADVARAARSGQWTAREGFADDSLLGRSATALVAAALGAAAAVAGVRQRSSRPHVRRAAVARRAGASPAANASATVPVLRLGTRGSPLALAQAEETKRRLGETFPELAPPGAVEVVVISTTGDERLDISLAAIGGKGLFTKELDVALLAKEVDFCVHSTKDVPTQLPDGTELCAMLPREDTRDVLISGVPGVTRIEDFPSGSIIGTASLRRQSQIAAKNPGLKCVNFRGNVQTRLRKLKAGEVQGTLLAYAGLKRMGMQQHATSLLEWEEMLPAIAQGAISFQCRSDDARTKAYLMRLSHEPTMRAVACERAFLAVLDGNCKTPIAGQARVSGGHLHFQGLVASPDGQRIFRVERSGQAADDRAAAAIGHAAGLHVRQEAGEEFFREMQDYVQDMQAANTRPTRD